MKWEYQDKILIFKETKEGLASDISWLNEAGEEGWEVVGSIPLIAPNKDGVAYGTVGTHILMKREK
jgi:hypothetical protein